MKLFELVILDLHCKKEGLAIPSAKEFLRNHFEIGIQYKESKGPRWPKYYQCMRNLFYFLYLYQYNHFTQMF